MIELGNETHGRLIAKSTNSVYNPGAEVVISRSEGGKLYGGVIFSCYAGRSMCIDVAGFEPCWLNRALLCVTFRYAFLQMNCNVLIGRLHSTNEKAIRFDTHIGFVENSRIKDAIPGGDLVILTLYKKDCKWLNYVPKERIQVWDHLRKVA